MAQVDADLFHDLYTKRMRHLARNTCADSLEIRGVNETQQGFRHGAMKTIGGTQKKNASLQNSASYSVEPRIRLES